jgi:hypothetical protein
MRKPSFATFRLEIGRLSVRERPDHDGTGEA